MIEIIDKRKCVGCNACTQRCPVNCISMHEDEEGFLYPHVDLSKCIDCGMCEKVCPVIHQSPPQEPHHVYAAKNNDIQIRKASSSGGLFTALAQKVIAQGGVVFGAGFNPQWEVEHSYTEDFEGIKPFQGSKYVQSHIGDTFLEAERFLKSGRKVMFTGTPCQIAALRLFLRKDYGERLLMVEVACHGVPSPMIWREYLKYVMTECIRQHTHTPLKPDDIVSVNFRDSRHGWRNYGFSVYGMQHQIKDNSLKCFFEPHGRNLFMRGFLAHLYMRPSCTECPAKCGKSKADITLADYWKVEDIHPDFNDNTGVSLVLAYTKAGNSELLDSPATLIKSDYQSAIKANPALVKSFPRSALADTLAQFPNGEKIKALKRILRRLTPSLYKRLLNRVLSLIRHK